MTASGRMVIVQASSRSWSGGRDMCMDLLHEHPVVYWTIRRVLEQMVGAKVVVAAPEFDRGGELDEVVAGIGSDLVSTFYGHDASPLDRLLDITSSLDSDEYVWRIDGLHLHFDAALALRMMDFARTAHLSCVKPPDDFPAYFSSDVYRVGALRSADALLGGEQRPIYAVHPKYYMFMRDDAFNCSHVPDPPEYEDSFLRRCRDEVAAIRRQPRLDVTEDRIWSGDQLSFHYEIAAEYIEPGMSVLDVACGDGFGTSMLRQTAREVHGADIDNETIERARSRRGVQGVSFHREDVENMSFGDASFDAVVSMETLEHVDETRYFREVRRVLKPGGILVLSTPQNRFGRIPYWSVHRKEYDLEQLISVCSEHFDVEDVVGIKAGRIVVPGDPIGESTEVVCVKRQRIGNVE